MQYLTYIIYMVLSQFTCYQTSLHFGLQIRQLYAYIFLVYKFSIFIIY